MYLGKFLAIATWAAFTTASQSYSDCSLQSTKTITINGPTVTETLVGVTSPQADLSSAPSNPNVATTIPSTVTSFLTVTQVISVVEPKRSEHTDKGPYLFHAVSGTTVWLNDKMPPGTASLVTGASTIIVQPAPTVVPGDKEQEETTTHFSTITLTSTAVQTHVLTLVGVTPSAKPFTGIAPYGWNSSVPIQKHVATEGAKVYDEKVHNTTIATRPTKVFHRRFKRQSEEWITATINGVVVSWVNNYTPPIAGAVSTTSASELSLSTTVTLQIVEVSSTTSSPSIAAYTTPAAYGWSPVAESRPSTLRTAVASKIAPTSSVISVADPLFSSIRSISPSPLDNTTSDTPSPTTMGTAALTSASETCSSANPTFTINFDDLPHFAVDGNQTEADVPPIFNPYRKMWWDDKFGYVPPPTDPYLPRSGRQLAVWRYDNENVDASPDAGLESAGEFGAGPHESDSTYWIDGVSAWLGCENGGPVDCTMYINGYKNGSSTLVAHQIETIPACPGGVGCHLQLVHFNHGFHDLDGIQILAAVGQETVSWYMDDLVLAWSNNTCAAQLMRVQQE